MNNLSLSIEERTQLTAMLETAPMMLQKRINLILFYDQGLPTHLAAQQAGFSPSQARFWKHQFLLQRLEIFNRHIKQPQEHEIQEIVSSEISPILSLPGVLPDDLMDEAGKKILYFHFQEMVKHEAGTIAGEDIEELHDMRVATRRMRAAFNIFGVFFIPKTINPFLQTLKTTGKSLGEVRDLDVSLEKIRAYLQQLPIEQQSGLDPLLNYRNSILDRARQSLLSHLNSQDYLDFKGNFLNFLQTPGLGSIAAKKRAPLQTTVRFQAPTLIYSRLASVMAFDSLMNSASYSQLHALRIEFKKFRYTLEFFKEVLGEESKSLINEIKDLQDHLGELNDANVACQTITRFMKKWDENQTAFPLLDRLNPEPVVIFLAYRYAERHQLMISFPEKWNIFNRPELRQNLAKAVAFL
jgi:CHAD domain-containing protein